MYFLIKLDRDVNHGERMDRIDFGVQRSKVKVTMDISGNKLVNTIATKPLCASWSNLVHMLAIVRGWTLLASGGQRSKVTFEVTKDIYWNLKLVNMIETKPLCIYLSNLAGMLNMMRGWTLLILEVRGQRSRSQWACMEKSCEPAITD